MQEMGWSYEELMSTPYERYLDTSRLISLSSKEEKRESEKAERKAKTGR